MTTAKEGDRVELVFCDDPDAPLPGTRGTVTFVDDQDTVFVDWDNKTSLGMIERAGDRFKLVEA